MTAKKSKLDIFGLAALMTGGALFVVSAILYLISIYYVATGQAQLAAHPTIVANWLGITGMAIIPIFIVSAIINIWREKRRGG